LRRQHVCCANWAVGSDLLDVHLPSVLTVDTDDGDAWLSAVPFTNVDTRPTWAFEGRGFPLPGPTLRNHVSHDGHTGVSFSGLDAHAVLGVVGACLFHYFPSCYACCLLTEADGGIRVRSGRSHLGARHPQFTPTDSPSSPELDVRLGWLEESLTEHCWYDTEARDGSLRYAAIGHEAWPLYETDPTIETNTLFEANGFAPTETEVVHYASPGVRTTASRNRRG
jgi:hypothetical protein